MAEIADIVSTAVLRRHLETMDRLDIEYDFLPRESEILRLHFWDLAFQQLKEKGVLYFETEGKNKGCWVMTRPAGSTKANSAKTADQLSESEESTGPDEDAKVIVRSNGTVGYVGKDIAYHLWKFGLLGRDFGYQKFFHYPDVTNVGSRPSTARPIIPTSATSRLSTTSSTPARATRKTPSSKQSGCSAIPKRPHTTRTFPTRWWRSHRVVQWNWATK